MNSGDKELTKLIIEEQELTRKRIAMDLHDSTVQSLTALGHKVEYCSLLVDKDISRVKEELSNLSADIRQIISEMRDYIFELVPVSIFDLGFNAAIAKLVEHVSANSKVHFVLNLDPNDSYLDENTMLAVYRVIQEASSNAVRHGDAQIITITSDYSEDLCFVIKDDGCGFDTSDLTDTANDFDHGYGIPFMKQRVQLLGGDMSITSKIGEGTSLCIKFNKN